MLQLKDTQLVSHLWQLEPPFAAGCTICTWLRVVSLTEGPLPFTPCFPLQHFLRQLRDLPLAAEPGLPITQQVSMRGARCAAACAVVALGTQVNTALCGAAIGRLAACC